MSFFDKLRTQKTLSFTLILFTLSLGIVLGTLVNSGVKAAKPDGASVAPGATPLVIPNPVELSNTFSQIAKQVEPSVVNISTEYLPKVTALRPRGNGRRQIAPQDDQDQGDSNGGMDDLLNRFFSSPGGPEMAQRKGYALGSGVVVDKAGYILTNNHVVDKADRIRVKFNGDPTEYDAKVVGVDVATDLAIIRVVGKTNPIPAKIGNSEAVQVGDWAMAIGSPFGFQATVTAGIISAKERDIPGDSTQFQHFLQTDAAINPGNSGGPLLNIRGEVIGMNTAIITNARNEGNIGIGFSVPSNTVRELLPQLRTGKIVRGRIGVQVIEVPRDGFEDFGLKSRMGALVAQISAGGASAKAGMEPGDVITQYNGRSVQNRDELVKMVIATRPGTTVPVKVLRNKQEKTLNVTDRKS